LARRFQGVQHSAGEVPLQASERFQPVLSLGPLAFEVLLRRRVQAPLNDGNPVQSEVELAVAAAIQSPPVRLA